MNCEKQQKLEQEGPHARKGQFPKQQTLESRDHPELRTMRVARSCRATGGGGGCTGPFPGSEAMRS